MDKIFMKVKSIVVIFLLATLSFTIFAPGVAADGCEESRLIRADEYPWADGPGSRNRAEAVVDVFEAVWLVADLFIFGPPQHAATASEKADRPETQETDEDQRLGTIE